MRTQSTLTAILILSLSACGGSDPAPEAAAPPSAARTLTDAQYYEKVHGAWVGAVVAGALGMTVEHLPQGEVKPFLEGLDQWPLTEYIKTRHPKKRRRPSYTQDDWGPTGFGPDDDTLYQVANLMLLEEKGPDITSQDIADFWLSHFSVFEAKNCGRAVRVTEKLLKEGVKPPESGQHEFGEFMGGQMKGEFWGYLLPGNPEAAAEYGRIDGQVGFHTDGLYGEMFMAALTAEAFFESDPTKLLEAGLAAIPADCDYAMCIRDVMSWHTQFPDDWEKAQDQINAKWGPEQEKLRNVFPNNAINALALLYGDGDFDKTIAIAVMAGWDTDTNAADVGPVLGIVYGRDSISDKWTDPIANILRTDVKGAEELKIDELSRRTVEMGKKMTAAKSAGKVDISD